MHLRERGRGVGDVLEHLNAQRGVEGRLLDGQRRRVPLAEAGVGVPRAAVLGGGEHLRVRVDAHDRAVGADLVQQLLDEEAWAAAHIEDAFAGAHRQRLAHQRPPPAHVAGAVQLLHLPRAALVEGQLAHRLPRPA